MNIETEYPDDFAASIAGEISGELFPETKTPSEASPLTQDDPQAVQQEPAQVQNPGVVPGQNSVGKPLPKSWKKDMEPEWAKLPPAVHDYVYAREADVLRGIQQYQTGYQQWDSLLKPYQALLQSNPDVQPIPLMQGLMNTHLQLLNPSTPAEQKFEYARKILADYGINLEGSPQAQDASQREIAQLRQTVQELQSGFQRTQKQAYETGLAEQTRLVTAFGNDPKNKYFEEVGDNILHFLKTGAAADLPAAYELACYANPVVRQKIIAEQQQSAPGAKQRAANGQFVNLESDPQAPVRPRKPQSIDSTIDSIVASHYSKH